MSPQLYYMSMLLTNPQKARRILLAEELENWFMDLFDEEYEDILEGTFKDNQEVYIDKMVDKYLEITGVRMTDTDEYSKSVINKAFKTASEIQDTTWKNIVAVPITLNDEEESLGGLNIFVPQTDMLSDFIKGGIAVGATMLATESLQRWLGRERANTIALNEANWKWNNQEYYEAKGVYSTKIWHTALDEKVRLTHMAVESAKVSIDEPFHVGNSLLMFAGDTSLGADASEIVNCRCTVSYE